MRRYSDSNKMKEAFLKLKSFYSNLSLETQCIVGFPTETWGDFKKTLNFIKDCNFYCGFLYAFSCRDGTDAAKIEPKVSQKEIDKRLKYAKEFLEKAGYKLSRFKFGISKNTYVFYLNK
jgi:tRNA A37 methylthiotransferase MiaB